MAFDLVGKSQEFAGELSDLLNATVCDGPRLNCLVFYQDQYTIVGYHIERNNLRGEGIPLKIKRDPKFFLSVSIHLRPDEHNEYLMVQSSAMTLRTDSVIANRNMLLHYDYEREKEDDYPEAHLQICATSAEWEQAGVRLDGDARLLSKLHLPVGGRRFRPTLEDIVEFLIVEKLVEARPRRQSMKAIETSREKFREKQLRAAIRRYPDVAIDQLRKDGRLE